MFYYPLVENPEKTTVAALVVMVCVLIDVPQPGPGHLFFKYLGPAQPRPQNIQES